MFTQIIINLSRKAYNKSFFGKIRGLILIFIVFFLPVIFVSFFAFLKINAQLDEMIIARRQAIAAPLLKTVEQELDGIAEYAKYVASNPRIIEAVIEKDWQHAADVAETYFSLSSQSHLQRIFFSDSGGFVKSGTGIASSTLSSDFSYRDWYKGVMRSAKPYISEVFIRQSSPQVRVVNVAVPIFNANNLIEGILVVQFRAERFENLLASLILPQKQQGFSYLLDQNGNIVAHPKFKDPARVVSFASTDVVNRLKSEDQGVVLLYNTIEAEWRMTAFQKSSRFGWAIVVQESFRSAYAEKNATLSIFMGVVAVILIFYGLVADGVIRAVRKLDGQEPIKK